MKAKFSLKLDYQSPFCTFLVYSNQKDYRLAWLLGQQVGLDLERIGDFVLDPQNEQPSCFPLFKYYCNKYRMNFFLLANKSESRVIVEGTPAADYLFLIWKVSEFFDLAKFFGELKRNQGIQALIKLEGKKEEKHRAFFHDLEFFLEEQSII